ncbi:MAG TPA: H-NS histone family protein [Burkholderiaceae bacterium]|nr:H-NS histone family protein [Burkholderiaceae bacterium]
MIVIQTMGNLIDIQSQIEKLQRQADDIKAKEFDKTVREIVAKMQAFGITTKDLQGAMAGAGKSVGKVVSRRKGKLAAGKRQVTVPAKYRGPNGETWSGRGLTPRWLAALVEQGQAKESFLIAP